MQIHLFIIWDDDNVYDLREKINQVIDLNKYINILPKSININTDGEVKISYIEKLFKIFDTSITSFNDIKCTDSMGNYRFLSNIAKNVYFDLDH